MVTMQLNKMPAVPPPATQRTSKEQPDETNASEDYLQDQNLWRDKLPQPFRMIDRLLQELYSNAWISIERREIEREHIAAKVKVPELTDIAAVEGVQGVKDVCGGRDGVIVVGGVSGLSAFVREEAGSVGPGCGLRKIAHCDTTSNINSIVVGWNNDIHFIATLHDKEVKVFALVSSHLVFLTDVINIDMSEDEEDFTSLVQISISQSSSHLSVTTTHPQDGTKLHLYKLPLNNWYNELNQFMERVANVEDTAENENTNEETEDVVYTKVAHLYTLSPPSSLTPCTATNPTTALQSVCDGQKHYVPTGELHVLRQCYFERRRKAFVSQRTHFVATQRDLPNYQQSVPTCHYLHYKNACRQETPCYLAVWWQHHTQLFIYPLVDSNKGPPLPHRVIPQASIIVATAVSEDSSKIAIGLQNGVITVWCLSTALCSRVASTGVAEQITALLFIEGEDKLCVGTNGGKVMVVTTLGNEPIVQLNQRVSKQVNVHSSLFTSSPYDTKSDVVTLKAIPSFNHVIVSIHSNGTLTMWSASECEALSTTSGNFSVDNGHCSFTSDGTHAVVLVENKQSKSSCLMTVNLQAVPTLIPHHYIPSHTHHDNQPIPNNMMLAVEAQLMDYTKRFMTDERWKNGPKVLSS